MNEFMIPCTEEQKRKALSLGAPVVFETLGGSSNFGMQYPVTPTAEEMVGWLEDQGIAVYAFVNNTEKTYIGWSYEVVRDFKNGGWKNTIAVPDIELPSYKEAILAAIDAALKYLSNEYDKK